MPKIDPDKGKLGTNLAFFDKEDHFLIKIMKDADTKESASGRSEILASSEGWLSLVDLKGELEDAEVGINLTVTVRKKAKKKDAKIKSK